MFPFVHQFLLLHEKILGVFIPWSKKQILGGFFMEQADHLWYRVELPLVPGSMVSPGFPVFATKAATRRWLEVPVWPLF